MTTEQTSNVIFVRSFICESPRISIAYNADIISTSIRHCNKEPSRRKRQTYKLFSHHDNLLLTREDGLVYNENNSSERNFLESYCYLLTVTKEVEE